MKKIIITFASLTYAVKAKRLLEAIGIASRLVKVDSSYSREGCTHGIEIQYNNFMAAVHRLKTGGIPYSVLKSEDGDGIS